LDRAGGTPAFAKQAISNPLPIRTDVYLQLTDAELVTLKDTHTLVPKPTPSSPSALSNLLAQLQATATGAQKTLLGALQPRFQVTRTAWPNPWALRLVDHAASEHMNPVLLAFKSEAWFVRIYDRMVSVVDQNNSPVTLETAITAPERIAAIYYVIDDKTPAAANSCENGRRELALGNEAMVAKFSLQTKEILGRMDSDIEALGVLFQAARPCTSFDKGGGLTFHAYTVCTGWDYFDPTTEYTAYQWSLSNPVEGYKPTPQNLSNLVEALKSDRFELDPFEAEPKPAPDPPFGGGGGGGMAGVGGSAGSAGSGGFAGAGGRGGNGGTSSGGSLGMAGDGGSGI
jgi:hypothetical protein